MNNCPKCGNPLQVGTASCPICGTDIAAASAQPTKTTVTVASVATPTTPPVNQPAPVVEAQPAAPVAAQPAPAPAPTPEPAQAVPVAPVTEAPTQPATQAPVAPVTEAPAAPVAAQPVTEPVAAPVTVDPNTIAPTVQTIDGGTPVPSIPASLNPDANLNVSAPVEEPKKAKKGINKNVLVILLVVLIAGGVGAFFLMGGMGKKTPLTPAPVTEDIAYTSVSTNGYKLKIQDGWIVTEDGDNVIVVNTEETVALKLAHTNFAVSSITKETIESYFTTRSDFTNTEILETTISAKEGYLVNTTMAEAPIQVYFIGGGNNLTIGATIVYVSAETKTKYEAEVTEMIGSLSYSDESLKAITTIDMFNGAFGVYNGIVSHSQNTQQPTPPEEPTTPDTPSNENPGTQEQPVVENPEQNNNGQNNPEPPVTEQ